MTQDEIAARPRSGVRLGVMDELEAVLAELEAVQAWLRRDLVFAEVEEGFCRIFAAVGADIVIEREAASTSRELADAIAATELAWMRGEIWLLPFPETGSG